MHHVAWMPGITYGELLSLYVTSVRNSYGSCHVVFDGYETSTVKDHEHIRRSSQVKSKEIKFSKEMKVIVKREDFRTKSKNKTLLISSLKPLLENDQQKITVSKADADTDIVRIALQVKFCSHL